MLIAKIENDKVVRVADYREELSHVSFPVTGPDLGVIQSMGYVLVNELPDYDPKTQKLVAAEPYLLNGWVYTSRAEALSVDELALLSESLALKVRSRRDALLASTVDTLNPLRWESFTQSQKDAWRQYRQELLDLPQQSGFPDSVVWPTPPQE